LVQSLYNELMEHYIFLVQMISMALAAASIILLIQKYTNIRQKSILFFIIAISLILIRIIVFALARYGQVSRYFVFPVRFVNLPIGGLVYVSLLYSSHIFLLCGMYALIGKKLHPVRLLMVLTPSLYSVTLFLILLKGINTTSYYYWIFSIESLSVIPILTVKTLLFYHGVILSNSMLKEKDFPSAVLTVSFFLILCTGQVFDGIFYAFEPFRYFTLPLSMVLPYTAYLILLPLILNGQSKEDMSSQLNDKLMGKFCRSYKLSEQEIEIIRSIIQGKSNKEIAYDNETTLSIIKHKIFNLYKKCGINSRWELINLLVN